MPIATLEKPKNKANLKPMQLYYPQEVTGDDGERHLMQGMLPAQKQAHAACDIHQLVAFIGGIGSAKTRWGAAQVARHLLRQKEDTEGIVCAKSYPMLRDVVIPALIRQFQFLHEQAPLISCEYKRSDNLLIIRIGPYKHLCHLLYAADADRARGIEAGWIWIDEAALVGRDAYRVLRGRLRKYRELRMWVTSTPKGKRHWLWDFCKKAVMVTARTADNPVVAHLEEELRLEYGSRWAAQELDGVFLDAEGAAFPELDIGEPHKLKPHTLAVGVDWGFSNEGAAVALAIGETNRCFVTELVARGQSRDWWKDELVKLRDSLQAEYKLEPVFYADPEDPEQILRCQRAGLRMVKANNKRLEGWRALTACFERGLVSGACQRLITDAAAAEWKTDSQDRPVEGEFPAGWPDHVLDAARYAASSTYKTAEVARHQIHGTGSSYSATRAAGRAL